MRAVWLNATTRRQRINQVVSCTARSLIIVFKAFILFFICYSIANAFFVVFCTRGYVLAVDQVSTPDRVVIQRLLVAASRFVSITILIRFIDNS